MVRAIRKWYEPFELDDLEERDQAGSLLTFFKNFRSIFLMSVGYGVGPANHEERLYTMFVAITGVIIFAFAMGNVTTIMQNTMGARSKFDERLRQVGEYLHFREVKPMLKRRILAHFGGCC